MWWETDLRAFIFCFFSSLYLCLQCDTNSVFCFRVWLMRFGWSVLSLAFKSAFSSLSLLFSIFRLLVCCSCLTTITWSFVISSSSFFDVSAIRSSRCVSKLALWGNGSIAVLLGFSSFRFICEDFPRWIRLDADSCRNDVNWDRSLAFLDSSCHLR